MEGEHEKSRDQTEGSGQQQPLGQQSENQTGQQDRQQPEGQQSQQQFEQQQGQSATGQAQSSDTDTLSKDDDDVGPGGYSPESGGSDLGGGETGLGDSGGSSSQGGFVGSQGQESGEYLQKGGSPQSGFAEQGRGASDQSDVERVAPTSEDRDSDIEGSSDNS